MENDFMACGGLVFLRRNGGRIKLGCPVVEAIGQYLQGEAYKPEAGGILLGRYIAGCEDVVADEVSVPMKGDKRRRYSFHRDHKLHQQVIDAAWVRSAGTCTYLGEWHTHPEDDPEPSRIDLNGWRKKMKSDRFDGNRLFFIIAGIKKIKIWEGDKRDLSIELLSEARNE